jgi:molybdate transport system substrate-binding protein
MKRALTALVALLATGCGGVASGPGASPLSDGITGTVAVFAAASLTDAFKDVATAFQKRHVSVAVQLNFAGSQALASQIDQGAPADVFASADLANMQRVEAAGLLAGGPRSFAGNKLAIVVPAGNPKGVSSLAGLSDPALVVVLCAPSVPCGSYAGQALQKAGVKVTPKSQEQDVKSVVTKVGLGEADAGIVYVTDVRAGGARVEGVAIPDADNVAASYPVAAVKGGINQKGGAAFIDFLLSGTGQAILAGYGFSKP